MFDIICAINTEFPCNSSRTCFLLLMWWKLAKIRRFRSETNNQENGKKEVSFFFVLLAQHILFDSAINIKSCQLSISIGPNKNYWLNWGPILFVTGKILKYINFFFVYYILVCRWHRHHKKYIFPVFTCKFCRLHKECICEEN